VRPITPSQSSADIPVTVNGEFFGIFILGFLQRRTFSKQDRELFRTLASRAGLAIQNALLFQESDRRASELQALHRADEALHRSLALGDVLTTMMDLAVDLLDAESSLVAAFGEEDPLEVLVSRNIRRPVLEAIERRYRKVDRGQFRRSPESARIALVEDLQSDTRVDPSLRESAVGSFVEIPVVVGEETWGIFAIGWAYTKKFSAAEERLFDAFSSRASLAIQNALLFEQAQLSASMEERQRIARDLHDSVSQALYGSAWERGPRGDAWEMRSSPRSLSRWITSSSWLSQGWRKRAR
jgi:GAF domain-containing protein